MFSKLQKIDNRVIYALVLVAIIFPLLNPIGIPFNIDEMTQDIFDEVENLPDGSVVMLAVDYSAGAAPQIHPQAIAMFKQLFYDKNCKIIVTAIASTGPLFYAQIMKEVGDTHGKVYGEDYVHLGFLAGTETAIAAYANSFQKAYPSDFNGTPIGDLPMMADIKSAADIDFAMIFTASEPSQYVRQLQGAYGVKLGIGINSVTVSSQMPYYNSGQLVGILNGLNGAAEYEALAGYPGTATAGMDAVSATALVVLAFIIIGNIAWAGSRKEGAK